MDHVRPYVVSINASLLITTHRLAMLFSVYCYADKSTAADGHGPVAQNERPADRTGVWGGPAPHGYRDTPMHVSCITTNRLPRLII